MRDKTYHVEVTSLGRLCSRRAKIQVQPHCAENLKHIFPEMKLRILLPNFYIHVSVSDLYISTIMGRSQKHECGMEIERQNIIILFGNNEAARFHFWEYINRNQIFILDSHRPFIQTAPSSRKRLYNSKFSQNQYKPSSKKFMHWSVLQSAVQHFEKQ